MLYFFIILYHALYFWSLVNVGCFARANFPVWEYCTRVSTDDTISGTFIICAESWLSNADSSPVFFKITQELQFIVMGNRTKNKRKLKEGIDAGMCIQLDS
jgi:hypothetical protein